MTEDARSKDPGRAQQRLRSIVEGTAAKTGDEFFRSLVRHLAEALAVRSALVAEVKPEEPDRARTLAVWSGDFGKNFEYPLAGTPCENVVNQTMCFYPRGIQKMFPKDHLLIDMGAESYLGTPLFDSSGNPLGLLAVLHDSEMEEDPEALDLLTVFASRASVELERTRAGEALSKSEERTRRIIETALDAVITIDTQGVVTGWNARAEAIFGWSEDEVMGRTLAETIIPPWHREAHVRGLERFLATGEGPLLGRCVEVTGLHKSGHVIPVELSIATIDTDGSHEFSAFVHDITERRKAEDERRELEGQVQHMQRLESLGVLAGGVAHDFSNLLTGILTNAAAARWKLAADHPSQPQLAEVVQGSKVASRLTGQLLAYAGKGEFHPRPLDLSTEVRGLEALLATSVRGRAHLVLDIEDDLPPVEVDPVQLHQVLMNLVINAAESTEEEAFIRIVARTILVDDEALRALVPGSAVHPGPHVGLSVEDNGAGMDAKTRDRIFDPFFTTKTTGRGLGLAATLGIVHGHGGGIRLESRPGAGTMFQVVFPISDRKVEGTSEAALGDLCSGVVLVVDDDEYVRRGVRCALVARGYTVLSADDGRRAVDLFSEGGRQIDLVILDVAMPGMGGEETLRALRAFRPDVKVLLSTGYPKEEAAHWFWADGVTGFLRKPYDPEELVVEVNRLLGERNASRPAEDPERELEALCADYRRRLPAKLEELAVAIRTARESGASRPDVNRVGALAHQLRGTSGSFGFRRLADELELVDETIRERLASTSPVTDADWDAIDRSLTRARISLESDTT
jgi:PAS domain S-box-containing protein